MVKKQENPQFLICSNCNGVGELAEQTCQVCKGKGIISHLDGYILFWGREINFKQLSVYKIERIVYKIISYILILISLLGFAGLVYNFYQLDFNYKVFLGLSYWQKHNPFLLLFWFAISCGLFLYYYRSLESDRKVKVIGKKYKSKDSEDLIIPPPISWQEIKNYDKKHQLDVSESSSTEAEMIIERSFEIAYKNRALEVAPIHLLVAALLNSIKAENVFARLSVDMNDLAEKLGRLTAKFPQSEGHTVFGIQAKKVLIKAYRQAYLNHMDEVDTLEIIQEAIKQDKNILELLIDLGITPNKIDNVVLWFRIRKLLQKQWLIYRASSRLKSKTGIDRAMTAVQTPTLNHFSEDLTMLAKIGGLDLSIDRENEYEEIFRILEGSSIKTVILVGDPGVGKTAIVEGLAQKMIADDVPDFLQDKRLVSLSISRLIAGAAMGEAQERLLICLSEIINAGNIVLFIDNLHDLMLIAEGGSLIEVLTESLSKNLLVLIASSNSINYKKYIENTSLGNIIKKIEISEPDIDGAIQIIEGKASFIEGKNNIYLSYDAIETAVKLTDRFIHDQFLPYKAITILEEIAVWAKKNKGAKSLVTGNDVAILFSEKINMPVSQITESESEKLLNLEQIIHDRMIDQEEAVSAVANSLRRARAELREIKRPIANLLFLGPTGVGKTELAKTIAEVYFNSEENMIRLDMSEYQEKNSINRLIGAPPGYAGAGEGGVLTEAVRQRPYSIVLLDELEKAHPDILNLFLQVMDDGRLTDSSGRTIDFTNVILIATSNAQTSFIQQKIKEGLTIPQIKDQLLETELKQYFKPEFINRFDNIIVFKPLSMEDIIQITKLMLKKVAKALEEKGVNFQTTEAAVTELAQMGFDPQYGARPLRRVIQDKVDNALANYLLTGKIGRRDIAIFDKGGIIRIEKAEKL